MTHANLCLSPCPLCGQLTYRLPTTGHGLTVRLDPTPTPEGAYCVVDVDVGGQLQPRAVRVDSIPDLGGRGRFDLHRLTCPAESPTTRIPAAGHKPESGLDEGQRDSDDSRASTVRMPCVPGGRRRR